MHPARGYHVHAYDYRVIMVQRPVRHSRTFYVRCMLICVAYSTDYIQKYQTMSIDFYIKYIRSAAASARNKPGPSTCQFDALTTTIHAPFSRNEVLSVWTNEMGLLSTQVPNSCRKWHRIHTIVLIRMAHCTFRSVVNVSSSFPPMRMQIEVWAVSNLKFVLLSFTILNLTIEVPFIVLVLYSLPYGTLKHGNGEAMPYTTFVRIKIYSVV